MFEALGENISNHMPGDGEIQLTDALETARSRIGMIGLVVAGRSYDIGLPEKYMEAMMHYGM